MILKEFEIVGITKKEREHRKCDALSLFNDVFRRRNVMCTSCVMFPLEVKCAFGTCYGTHYITANEASNITMRCITSLWRSQNFTKYLSCNFVRLYVNSWGKRKHTTNSAFLYVNFGLRFLIISYFYVYFDYLGQTPSLHF